jgi:BASS family bile acid:Na+ symporter
MLAGRGGAENDLLHSVASFKNLGMAAAVSFVLFGPKVGIPAAVCILAETVFYILFAALRRRGSLI